MDKSIFNEAIPTSEQKALLKQRIFETYTEKTENEKAKVFSFKHIAQVAAAFVVVVGVVALLTLLAGLGGAGIDVSYTPLDSNSGVASVGGVDGPESVIVEATGLKKKYPQYFDVDTTKGLVVYVWQMAHDDYSCALVSGKNIGYIDRDIESSLAATPAEMKVILETYDIDSNMISVMPFHHSLSSYVYEIDDDYVAMLREKLGLKTANEDDWGITVSANFKNETQFTLTITQTLPDGEHLSGELTTGEDYEIYVDYNGERISLKEYAQLTGLHISDEELAWHCIAYKIAENGTLTTEEDLSKTYGALPTGKYYIKKNIRLHGDGGYMEKSYYAPFEVKLKPTISDDEKNTVISVANGVDVKLGDGRYSDYYGNIFEFDFAVVYDTPHNFYYDTFTENGGNLPQIPTVDENTVYKKIKVGDDLNGHGFKVTYANFNANVKKDSAGNIIGFDKKIFENKLRAEGNVTVTAYAYKQGDEYEPGDVMIVIDPTRDMNGDITFYRLYGEKQNSFSYVSENGGIFEASSNAPIMTLLTEDKALFEREGLWEVELDVSAIEMVYSERGDRNRVSLDVSDIRFIKEVEVSDPVAE